MLDRDSDGSAERDNTTIHVTISVQAWPQQFSRDRSHEAETAKTPQRSHDSFEGLSPDRLRSSAGFMYWYS